VLKLFRFLKPYIPSIVAVFFLTFFQAISELYLPTLMSDIVDNGIVNGDTDYILTVGGRMLVIALLGMACAVFSVCCPQELRQDSANCCAVRFSAG